MNQVSIREFYKEYAKYCDGCISRSDGRFLAECLVEFAPKNCLEIGVASGFSSAFILHVMENRDRNFKLVSVDFAKDYYIDPEKPVGFIIDQINPTPRCKFELHTGFWAADLPKLVGQEKFDVIFIDANHRHPWTWIDLVLSLPRLSDSGLILLHDIHLYKNPKWSVGIGPHNVYDGIEEKKWMATEQGASIGAIQFRQNCQAYESNLLEILNRPWSLAQPIAHENTQRLFRQMANHYTTSFVQEVTGVFEKRNRNAEKAA